MGVAGLYRWLVQRYPVIRQMMTMSVRPKFTHFYIDANCIVYNSLANFRKDNFSVAALIRDICRYMDLLVQLIKPEDVLFICLDGPAPLAKCAQQRSRRFLAARDSHSSFFDKNQISVGTPFMEDLYNSLTEFFQEKTKTDDVWRKPQVIFSPSRVPGEGEHKIFELLRLLQKSETFSPNTTHCVYSPDADLIFLCLQSKQPYFYIMKEADAWIGPNEKVGNGKLDKLRASGADFELVNLHLAREYLCLDYATGDVDSLIDDFAAFSMLLGDDFIPAFPDVSIQQGHYGKIVECYQNHVLLKGKHLVKNDKLDKVVWRDFLNAVVSTLARDPDKGKPAHNVHSLSASDVRNYILSRYPDVENYEEFEKELAFDVLDSFDWVLEYYLHGCPSWTWTFPKLYPPPLSVVAKYCTEHTSHFELGRPPYPIEQLLCIMPIQSSGLLPPSAAALMRDSELAHMYPEKFELDLNGRKFEHDAILLIPPVDLQKVRNAVERIQDQFTEEEKRRNSWMEPLLFKDGSYRTVQLTEVTSKPHDTPQCVVSFFADSFRAPIHTEKAKAVHIFGKASYEPSLIVQFDYQHLTRGAKRDRLAQLKQLEGKVILANWPICQPVVVRSVCPPDNQVGGKTVGEMCQRDLREKRAITVVGHELCLKVSVLEWLDSAETIPGFWGNAYCISELTLPVSFLPDRIERWKVPDPKPVEVGMKVVIINGPHQGKVGEVLSISDKTLSVKTVDADLPDLSSQISADAKEWIPLQELADRLSISEGVLSSFLRTLIVNFPNGEKIDMAFTALAFCVPRRALDGFVKFHGGQTLVTKEFEYALDAYLHNSAVGNLYDLLTKASTDTLTIAAVDLYGSKAEAKQKSAEVAKLVSQELLCRKYFLRTSAQIISQTTMEAIEHHLTDKWKLQERVGETVDVSVDDAVWPGKPLLKAQSPEKFGLGKRVVNVMGTGSIPFGVAGTVVGMSHAEHTLDVVLDVECPYAQNLRGRLRTCRGFVAKCRDVYLVE